MQAILFNFSKRLNSTKRPNDAEGVPVTVSIKQNVPKGQSSSQSGTETFLSHPTIWVQGDYTEYNYMKFKGRYYFVRDIQLTINNATVIYGEIDALASYKEYIQQSSQFVMYDETVNTEIPDKRLAVQTSEHVSIASGVHEITNFTPSGKYIVTVNGEGNIESYVIAPGLIKTLTDGFDDWAIANLTNEKDLLRQLCSSGSISENIKNAIWLPFDVATSGQDRIELGAWQTNVYGNIITSRLQRGTGSVNIPWQYGDWRDTEPYTYLYLYIPFVGVVNYPSNQLRRATSFEVVYDVDVLTGETAISVRAYGREFNMIIATYGANIGANFMIGESNITGRQLVTGISQGVSNFIQGEGRMMMGAASIATGNVASGVAQIGAGFSAFGNCATNLIDAFTPINNTVGGLSSAAAAKQPLTLDCWTVSHRVVGGRDGASQFFGTPTMTYKSLSNISGYVECENATVDVPAIGCVRDLINTALNRGIYIE